MKSFCFFFQKEALALPWSLRGALSRSLDRLPTNRRLFVLDWPA
jgi:hypothetical protein